MLGLRDHANVFQPRWFFIREAIESGRIPFLTRASPDGFPLEGMLNGTYIPASILAFLGPFESAYDHLVIGHFLVLATGAYALALVLGAKPEEAGAGAIAATLAGPIVSFDHLVVGIAGLSLTPWVITFLILFVRRPDLSRAGALSLAFGFQLQAVLPVTALVDVIALFLVLAAPRPRLETRHIFFGACAALLALGIASLGLLPALELLQNTTRGRGFDSVVASTWSFRWDDALELLAPCFRWQPDIPFSVLRMGNGVAPIPYLHSLYLGSILPMALAGLTHRTLGRNLRLAILAFLVLAFMLTLGSATPLFPLIAKAPVFRSDRFPIKYIVIEAALLAFLVPLGLRSEPSRARAAMLGTAGLQVGLTVGLMIFLSTDEASIIVQDSVMTSKEKFMGIDAAEQVSLVLRGARAHVFHAMVASSAMMLLLLVSRARARDRLPVPGLSAVLILDLALAARFGVVGVPANASSAPLEEAAARENPHHRLAHLEPSDTGVAAVRWNVARSASASSLASSWLRGENAYRKIRKYEWSDRNGLGQPLFFLPGKLLRFARDRDMALRLLARAGVAWVSSSKEKDVRGVRAFPITGEAPQYLFPNPFTRPVLKAYARWQTIALDGVSGAMAAQLLSSPETVDVAFIAPGVGAPLEDQLETGTSSCGTAKGQVESSRIEDGLIEAVVSSECPTLLVTLEPFAERWSLELDDAPHVLVMADAGLMAAPVPPGRHTLRFRYDSLSELYAPIAGASLLASVLCVLFGRRFSRWPRTNA